MSAAAVPSAHLWCCLLPVDSSSAPTSTASLCPTSSCPSVCPWSSALTLPARFLSRRAPTTNGEQRTCGAPCHDFFISSPVVVSHPVLSPFFSFRCSAIKALAEMLTPVTYGAMSSFFPLIPLAFSKQSFFVVRTSLCFVALSTTPSSPPHALLMLVLVLALVSSQMFVFGRRTSSTCLAR